MAAVLLPKWDCATCTASMKHTRGCGVPGTMATMMGPERLTTCPLILLKTSNSAMHDLYRWRGMMEKGFLPHNGGVEDQSNKIMQALDHLDAGIRKGLKIKKPPKS